MATLVARFQTKEKISDPNMVKVIMDANDNAIYFSRSVIPCDRAAEGVGDMDGYWRHVGIYAYRKEFLLKVTSWPQARLEKTEKLEQLRVLENGVPILVGKVEHTCDGIDTPQQYAEFVKRYETEHNRAVSRRSIAESRASE
jgi:3-deoxy-manno-octulosonate cytidylyltransferase (CMP-KDO synthetase)